MSDPFLVERLDAKIAEATKLRDQLHRDAESLALRSWDASEAALRAEERLEQLRKMRAELDEGEED